MCDTSVGHCTAATLSCNKDHCFFSARDSIYVHGYFHFWNANQAQDLFLFYHLTVLEFEGGLGKWLKNGER